MDEKGEVSPNAVIGDIWQAVAHDSSSDYWKKVSNLGAYCKKMYRSSMRSLAFVETGIFAQEIYTSLLARLISLQKPER